MPKKKAASPAPDPVKEAVDDQMSELFVVAQMAATIYSTFHQRTQALDEEGRMKRAVEEAIGILHWTSEGLANIQAREKQRAG